jgi:hypothetical protein
MPLMAFFTVSGHHTFSRIVIINVHTVSSYRHQLRNCRPAGGPVIPRGGTGFLVELFQPVTFQATFLSLPASDR